MVYCSLHTTKRIAGLSVLLLFTTLSFGQVKTKTSKKKKDDFLQQIDRINDLFAFYGTLHPFSDIGNHPALIDSTRTAIADRLLNVLNDKRILKYSIKDLFDTPQLSISNSADHHIYIFSFDEKTGGSYESRKVFLHYRLPNGMVKGELLGEEGTTMATCGYGEVYLLDSTDQKYFVTGNVRTCNTCEGAVAVTVKIDTNSCQKDVLFEFSGGINDLLLFDYNTIEKEFTYAFYVSPTEDAHNDVDNQKGELQHKIKGKYKYLQGVFEEIEKCELWEKRE
jgi:hypothetical protein